MPDDVRHFLTAAARQNCTSQNAEFIRAVRERMMREVSENKAAPESVRALARA
ncbi:Arc domain-containing protein [Methylobacterium guangdongense]|uniref:Arc domain-containing protein n=1 Tax=Methylobacterium guangdongense TaxID=3138811 RepID=UPI00399C5C44